MIGKIDLDDFGVFRLSLKIALDCYPNASSKTEIWMIFFKFTPKFDLDSLDCVLDGRVLLTDGIFQSPDFTPAQGAEEVRALL